MNIDISRDESELLLRALRKASKHNQEQLTEMACKIGKWNDYDAERNNILLKERDDYSALIRKIESF